MLQVRTAIPGGDGRLEVFWEKRPLHPAGNRRGEEEKACVTIQE
jgi:hypothetical protein